MYLSSWSVLLDKNSVNNAIGEKTPEVFYKKLFLKILQYSQENICERVPF